jgi:hypothetical protein
MQMSDPDHQGNDLVSEDLAGFRDALAAHRLLESRFREAVALERADEAMRRRLGIEELPTTFATPGVALRLGLELARGLSGLRTLARRAVVAPGAHRGPDGSTRESIVARAVGTTARDLRLLAEHGWRDPWWHDVHGRVGDPSPFDPLPPSGCGGG